MVWQARQLPLDRLVAVKVYARKLDEGDRRRFVREAAAAGRLSDHDGVVTAHAAGILPDDSPYLIMELCPGGSLTRWLEPENRPTEERLRQAGARIADALAAVHACGVLHCDLKPANILIDRYGNPRLADFGLASFPGTESAAGTESADMLRLTPAYAPPETLLRQSATEFGDVYSLAATLYAVLAGKPPRQAGSAPLSVDQIIELASRPIDRITGAGGYLMDVLLAALSNDAAARPTAAAFRDQLAQMPAPRTSTLPLVEAAEQRSSARPRRRPLLPVHPAVHWQGVAAASAPAEWRRPPDQVAPAETPRRRGGQREGLVAVAAALVPVVVAATAWLISAPATRSAMPSEPSSTSAAPSRAADQSPAPPTSSPRPPREAGGAGAGSAAEESVRSTAKTIQLTSPADSARPFQTVPIQGTYRGGEDTLLRVQRWEAGKWLAFPLPAKTDQSGQFNAYVELGQPNRYRLRVLDPDSGVTSKPFLLLIEA